MKKVETYNISGTADIIGVGIGPFNLGLSALLAPLEDIQSLFFDSKPHFDWHPGLLLEDCTLQVPMLADLVTMVDPTSRYSYLHYLHTQQRLYHFYFYENFMIPRIDYNKYCQWVSQQITSLQFSKKVNNIEEYTHNGIEGYCVTVLNLNTNEHEYYHSQHIALGVGSSPSWPKPLETLKTHPSVVHSSSYLQHKRKLQGGQSITVIGSGQSAGEIVLDLLDEQNNHGYEINWLTRSHGFLPMEYSKLGLEHFSPEYIDYFHALPEHTRDNIRGSQDLWYKGISEKTIADIYDRLYKRSISSKNNSIPLTMQARTELHSVDTHFNDLKPSGLHLHCHHLDQNKDFTIACDKLILATGHQSAELNFLKGLKKRLLKDKNNRSLINRNYCIQFEKSSESHIYTQNAEIHSHGIGSPDLGLGAYRSASIINHLLKREVYQLPKKNVFQEFGIAKKWQNSENKKTYNHPLEKTYQAN